ncbi:hypothetical protein M8J76_014839 [Diaphorina citri]|nr:hypothetical protein M8J76_014839 [Diaphorina citri]
MVWTTRPVSVVRLSIVCLEVQSTLQSIHVDPYELEVPPVWNLDSGAHSTGCLYDHIRWGEAFVIVYSVTDKTSFLEAQFLLGKVGEIKLPTYFSTLLLGNKRDLDHFSLSEPRRGSTIYLKGQQSSSPILAQDEENN